MGKMKYQIHSYNQESRWISDILKLNHKAWPGFMQGEKVMRSYWGFILGNFEQYQCVLTMENEIVAVINAAPFYLGADVNDLHKDGIYWGLKQVTHNFYQGMKPDTLLALQIVVNQQYQGRALSYECLEIFKSMANEHGLTRAVIPLRPSRKHLYPLLELCDYLKWKDPDGFPYDPWLRVHKKAGGEIVKLCKGITIQAPLEEWQGWTGLHFGSAGSYIVPGALQPVEVDLDRNLGTYGQENVWVVHRV